MDISSTDTSALRLNVLLRYPVPPTPLAGTRGRHGRGDQAFTAPQSLDVECRAFRHPADAAQQGVALAGRDASLYQSLAYGCLVLQGTAVPEPQQKQTHTKQASCSGTDKDDG